jgi:hypothetical protein
MNILILPDSHSKPGVPMRRFHWLARYLIDTEPDVLLCLGDLADMPSLSSYDGSILTGTSRKKASFNNRNIQSDFAAANHAITFLNEFRGKKIFLMGNHEERINRALSNVPELQGTLGLHNLHLHSWEVVPFLEDFSIGGIAASHYFVTGVMGKSIGGDYPAANLLRRQYQSAVMGHSHVWDIAIRKGSRKLFGLVAGCYLDPTQKEEYAGPAQGMWTSGVTLLRDVRQGFPHGGWEFIPVTTLEKAYGKDPRMAKSRR